MVHSRLLFPASLSLNLTISPCEGFPEWEAGLQSPDQGSGSDPVQKKYSSLGEPPRRTCFPVGHVRDQRLIVYPLVLSKNMTPGRQQTPRQTGSAIWATTPCLPTDQPMPLDNAEAHHHQAAADASLPCICGSKQLLNVKGLSQNLASESFTIQRQAGKCAADLHLQPIRLGSGYTFGLLLPTP